MAHSPTAINYYAKDRILEVTWGPGHVGRYPTKWVRAACGCAGCVDERTGIRTLDIGSIPEDIDIRAMRAVGNYAVQFEWSDDHDTGIYSWDHLLAICPCPACHPCGYETHDHQHCSHGHAHGHSHEHGHAQEDNSGRAPG